MSINLKELVLNVVETQKNSLLANGYKQIPGFSQYQINEHGNIIRLKEDGGLSEVPMSLNKGGRYKVNLINSNNKQITVIVHRALYETFKGAIDSNIEFINDDPTDIRLTNLITTQELLDFYRKANNILLPGQEETTEPEATTQTKETEATAETTETKETEETAEPEATTETKEKEKKSIKKNNVRVIKGKKNNKAEDATKTEIEKQKKEA